MGTGGNIAIIGGSGLESLPGDIFAEEIAVDFEGTTHRLLSISNNYTEPHKLYFLPRHGGGHSIPPHLIDYSGNIRLLRHLEVRTVLASNAVGSLHTQHAPGDLICLDDFIDFTRGRPVTFFTDQHWAHTDFSRPYSEAARRVILAAAEGLGVPVKRSGTYLCCDGPRYESPAEVRLFASWGADVVGMTGLPEAVFAREAGLDYAALAIVTNLGAGLSSGPISHEEVTGAVTSVLPVVLDIFMGASALLSGAAFSP